MNSGCYIEFCADKECGDLHKNSMYLKRFSLVKFHKSDYESGTKSKIIKKKLMDNYMSIDLTMQVDKITILT